MIQMKIRHDASLREKRITVKEAESLGLDRPAEKQGMLFQRRRKLRYHSLTDAVTGDAVKDQSERSFSIVLANQNNASMKKRPVQPAIVEQ